MGDGRAGSVTHERLCVRETDLGWTMEGLESEDKQLSSNVTESRELREKCKDRHGSTKGPARHISFAKTFRVVMCRTGLHLLREGQVLRK